MKFSYLILAVLLLAGYQSYAQNTYPWPTTGPIGIGTTTPVANLDVNSSIAISGMVVNASKAIAVTSDGTYVVASGTRIKGTYTLNFEAANRVQTAVLLVSATQYDGGSSLSVLSNTSYSGVVVMSNFRLLFSTDMASVYLAFDVANRNSGTLVSAYFNGTGAYGVNWGGTLPTSPLSMGSYPLGIDNGNVGIGTINPNGYRLAVNGTIHAKQVNVDLTNWADYVFKKNYPLRPLSEVKAYIDQNQHLPEIPSEQEIAENGLNLGEMNKLLMNKVEELTLYLIEVDKEKAKQEKVNAKQQQQINQLIKQVEALHQR